MDWVQVQTVMRLWSLRPWLYEWDIYPLHEGDVYADQRWCRWFNEKGLTKKATSSAPELSDEDFAMVDRIYKIYQLVFDDEKEFSNKAKSMNDVLMLLYNQSSLEKDWSTPLMARAKETKTIKIWIDKLPQKDDTDILLLLFVCYNYCILLKVVDRAPGGLSTVLSSILIENSEVEEKKNEGNKAFKEQKYSTALEWYTAAIKLQCYNKKLYSNRAQCYIHKYIPRAAASDGLRCVRIDPLWEKGWWRYAQGLYNMGKVIPAWKVNEEGLNILPEDKLKELKEQAQTFELHDEVIQYLKFRTQDSSKKSKSAPSGPKVNGTTPAAASPQTTATKTTREKTDTLASDLPGLVPDFEDTPPPVTKKYKSGHNPTVTISINTTITTPKKSDSKSKNTEAKKTPQKADKVAPVITTKASKQQGKVTEAAPNTNNNNNNKMRAPSQSQLAQNLSPEVEDFKKLLSQATSALLEKRMRNAVTLYTQALTMLNAPLQKALDYHSDQVAIVLYALGYSNINIGGEKDLDEGLRQFNNIFTRFPGLIFPLAYLGIGLTYFKWNRFTMAIEPLSKGLRLAKNHSLDTVYSWPESKTRIEESEKKILIERLEDLLAQSHWPPAPLATCRFKECGHYQVQIYMSDPDFNGYIEMTCLAQCKIAYHQDCWKKTRSASTKEILNGKCFTPDCQSPLKNIITYDLTGEPCDEKENPITKEPAPRKPSKKTPASSQYTLMRRQQKKEMRKQKRQEERMRQAEAANVDNLVNELEKVAEKKTEAEVKPAPDLRTCNVIIHKKDDDNDDNKKHKKKRRAPKEPRPVVRLDLVPPEQAYMPSHTEPDMSNMPALGSFGGLDDFEELSTYPPIETPNAFPFAVPPQIAAQVAYLDDVSSQSRKSSVSVPSRSESPAVSETTEREKEIDDQNNRTAIRESIFQLFKGILQENGPLQIDDIRITSHLADFPPETMSIIDREGGIGSFLKKSVLFTVVDDIVGLLKHRTKILKEVAKNKAQARKAAANGERRSKKVTVEPIAPNIKPAPVVPAPSVSTSGTSVDLAASRSASSIDIESDHESIASSDTGTSESLEMTSNSSHTSGGRNKVSSLVSGSGVNVKSASSWQRPSTSPDDLTYNPTSVDTEVINQYRLGANRLQAAVELGRLAFRVNMRLGVEVRFLYGWKLTAGLEKVDVGTSQQAATLLKDGIQHVTSSTSMVYNTSGAEVYFFGTGQNSVEGERGQWVTGPEVGYNHGIIIALALDHVDMSTVNLQTLDHSADTLLAVKAAAETIRNIKDRFKASMEIKNALQPIFTTIGRRIAADDPETLSLLSTSVPKLPPGLSLNMSLPPLPGTASPLLNSPVVRPPSATSSPRSAASPAPNTPTHNSTNPSTIPSTMGSPFGLDASRSVSVTIPPSGTTATIPPPGLANASSASSSLTTTPMSMGGIPSSGLSSTSSAAPSSLYASFMNVLNTSAPSTTTASTTGTPSLFSSMSASTPGTGLGSIWGSSSSASTGAPAGFPSTLYGFNDPLTAAAKEREQQEQALQVAKKQAKEYSQMVETLQITLGKMSEQLTNVTADCAAHKKQVSMQADKLKVQEARITQMTEREELMKDQIHQLTEENVQTRKQVEHIKANAEDNMAAAKREIAEHKDRAAREKTLRTATESQYQDVLHEREEQYKRLEAQHVEEKLRAQKAEVAMLQLKMDVGLSIIDRSTKEAEHYIATIRAQANQYIKMKRSMPFSDQFLAVPAEYSTAEGAWKMTLTRLKKTREDAITAFEEQKKRVIAGELLSSLPNLSIPCPPPAPDMPQLRPPPMPGMAPPHRVMGNGDSAASHGTTDPLPNGKVTPPTVGASAAPALSGFSTKAQQPPTAAAAVAKMAAVTAPKMAAATAPKVAAVTSKPASRPPGFSAVAAAAAAPKPATKAKNSFDRIVDHIQIKHPELDRSRISALLQKVRQSRNGSLSGMKMEDVLASAEFFITQENEKARWGASGASSSSSSMRGLDPVELGSTLEQDPCTICLDELLPSNTQELDCRHRFHAACIRQWLKEKSTCPNCNKHALLSDDFPKLC